MEGREYNQMSLQDRCSFERDETRASFWLKGLTLQLKVIKPDGTIDEKKFEKLEVEYQKLLDARPQTDVTFHHLKIDAMARYLDNIKPYPIDREKHASPIGEMADVLDIVMRSL